ncbi:DUF3347 domain-containing protein [Catalinimonas niigatensis]|uniref:DUF3347 domain-containing protein n=1 Tax=Catalinimonas niigatensis TaxID=1397264 RepID=UPI0026665AD0|nr:DUF3347 domain-containing protein [Catalinimonas niigatensis]WPP50098.1 DUF3347 domain-containing protein [Catalinimonas niigatensis]
MKNAFQSLLILLIIAVLTVACGERHSEQAQGKETELAGDEPDETPISDTEQLVEYQPADTLVNIKHEDLPEYLPRHLQVVVSAYLNIEEALVNDNAEAAKAEAQELINLLQRHEQENIGLEPEVKNFYTNAAHIIRQSAVNIVNADELLEIRSAFSAMAPATYKMAKVSDFFDNELYYHFCPQSFDNRGAYWLSSDKEINNPYAEQDKKSCGETVAVL